MKISIIVPTYNEQNDIAETLNCLIDLDWPDYEIIVVDDSTDRTPEIVCKYRGFGVKLIKPIKRDGRCGARNIGITESSGEIIVILNADVLLPRNFLKLISEHYYLGADYVLVKSVVKNMKDLFARYVECVSVFEYYESKDIDKKMDWTEGFSCRRSIAIQAGLFPSGFLSPLCAGEDGFFGNNIRNLGAKKIIDLNIICTHLAPATFSEYWNIRKSRGEGSAQVKRFLKSQGVFLIGILALLRVFKTAFLIITLIPMLYLNYRFARKSPKKLFDLIPFCWAWIVEQIAFSVGEWLCLIFIIKNTKKLT